MSDYGNQSYWDHRYETANEQAYDWFFPYASMRQSVYGAVYGEVPSEAQKQQLSVLIVGCGNSELSADMYKDGFTNMLSVDYSEVVLKHMKQKHPHLHFQFQDVRNLDLPDASFDLVIDKGTLDSILCGQNSTVNAQKMLNHIYRVLKPSGVFLEYTYGTPTTRISHLSQLSWTLKDTSVDGRFLYILQK